MVLAGFADFSHYPGIAFVEDGHFIGNYLCKAEAPLGALDRISTRGYKMGCGGGGTCTLGAPDGKPDPALATPELKQRPALHFGKRAFKLSKVSAESDATFWNRLQRLFNCLWPV